jgi:hypothetical protein
MLVHLLAMLSGQLKLLLGILGMKSVRIAILMQILLNEGFYVHN